MRKLKKINGYMVVRFNDRERALCPDLGAFGVIDAELYSGVLEVDLDCFDYTDADTLDAAIESARCLESELDIDETTTHTLIREDACGTEITEVKPQLMLAGWKTTLKAQLHNKRYPGINPGTARHELYGYMVALRDLGLIPEEECFVEPDTFDNWDAAFSSVPPPKRITPVNKRAFEPLIVEMYTGELIAEPNSVDGQAVGSSMIYRRLHAYEQLGLYPEELRQILEYIQHFKPGSGCY